MERNGRKSSRISFPVSASPLPGGGQVTAGTTWEKNPETNEFLCGGQNGGLGLSDSSNSWQEVLFLITLVGGTAALLAGEQKASH